MIRKVRIIITAILGCLIITGYVLKTEHDNSVNPKYSNCELGDLVGDDVERIEYQNFYIDYHTEDFTKSQIEDFAQKCADDGVKNQYQMDCCVRMKMYPED